MPKPKISLIAALAENRAIGKDNKLLFRIPEDLKRFKKLTSDHPIIMGRKTYESIGRPLPNRTNIVVTRNKSYKAAGCIVVSSIKEALRRVHGEKEILVIGGGQIYAETIKDADKLYLTIVEGNYDADTFFPEYPDFKKVTFRQSGQSNRLKYKFLDLER